jgi:hypothetical protein
LNVGLFIMTNTENEIWKDVHGYEGLYQVSNLGKIKSLNYRSTKNKIILKNGLNTRGYSAVSLSKKGNVKSFSIHQLVAIAFLNHTPCGFDLVVNHKNFIKTDNRLENLEIITTRENANLKHIKSSSQYTGVSWNKKNEKWTSQIIVNRKRKHLGYFTTEEEASEYYDNALISIKNNDEIIVNKKDFSSKYKGVLWCKQAEKWQSNITINKNRVFLIYSKKEQEAYLFYTNAVKLASQYNGNPREFRNLIKNYNK